MATKKTTSETGGTKPKSTAQPAAAKSAGAAKPAASKPKAAPKPDSSAKSPSLEDIRRKAGEIYLERISRGEPGSAEEDWLRAEKLLKSGK